MGKMLAQLACADEHHGASRGAPARGRQQRASAAGLVPEEAAAVSSSRSCVGAAASAAIT